MKNLILSLAVSLLLHGLIAVALIAYLEYAPQPDALATLDLSSVELSFAEQVEETAAAAPQPPTVGHIRRPQVASQREVDRAVTVPSPPQEENAPATKLEKPIPPDLSSRPAPRQARIDAPPRPWRNIKPDYPKGARQRGEQGDVVLEIRVNEEGTVDDVRVAVSSGFAELDEAAANAAKGAKFSPARSGREPVASTVRLKLQFKLR